MTQLGKAHFELEAMAEKLEKEGICTVREFGEWKGDMGFSVHWSFSRGEDFVKASAFAHAVEKWADIIEGDNTDVVVMYSAEDINKDRRYIIKIYPVWL